jgi:hypothetical protein
VSNNWQVWFAWRPVKMENGNWGWWRCVYRFRTPAGWVYLPLMPRWPF